MTMLGLLFLYCKASYWNLSSSSKHSSRAWNIWTALAQIIHLVHHCHSKTHSA